MKSFISFLCILFFMESVLPDNTELTEYIRQAAQSLDSIQDLDPLIEAASDRRFVLLGEASHGTSEYYTWRAEISKRLIVEKGFRYIAVEGDWTSAYEVNKYVKGLPGAASNAREVLGSFDRWPQWMWNNEEVKSLIAWLRDYNLGRPVDERVGFYGIDIYATWESIREVIYYFASKNHEKTEQVRNAYACLTAFEDNPQGYAAAVYHRRVDCKANVEDVVSILREHAGNFSTRDPIGYFNAKQNALVVKNAERHYRAMVNQGPDSWNYRVRNFKSTVERLADFYGEDSKGIVWAHNTHVGDARATPMAHQGMENIGYLLRDTYGEENVFIVGFGTHRGSVLAGRQWGAPMETMIVPEAVEDSFGNLFYQAGISNALLIFQGDIPASFFEVRGHRAKGVIYNPLQEHGNYVPTILPQRYNAFIFIEVSNPLTPL
jgi:erythromycin esterase